MSFPPGILLVDKPVGPTSHDVVSRVRKAVDLRRVGHAGTLDPFASGLLIILIGKATRLSEYLLGLDKVYELGRVFRNEGISVKHNPEFTLMECYCAYADYEDMMDLTERLFSFVALDVLGSATVRFRGHEVDLAPPWKRIYLRDAIREASGIDFEDYPDAEGLRERMLREGVHIEGTPGRGRLIDELISTFVEPTIIQPTFLLDYPLEMSPFPKKKRGNERLVERFEAFICGLEFANAFTELNDPVDQRRRLEEQMRGKTDEEDVQVADEDFLEAMEHGMPPTGGLGIGIDRFIMLLTGQESIRDVILFPQLRGKRDA